MVGQVVDSRLGYLLAAAARNDAIPDHNRIFMGLSVVVTCVYGTVD